MIFATSILLLVLLLVSAGFTIGLTYAPCYASVCSEENFGLQTRIHIAVYYSMLTIIGGALMIRSSSTSITHICSTYLIKTSLPVSRRRVSIGGFCLGVFIAAVTLATTAIWLGAELNFWELRTAPLDWSSVKERLAATGTLGHYADILLGLVVIPVGRHSLLARVFHLHQGTLLFFHKFAAYSLVAIALGHGAAYYTFVAAYNAAKDNKAKHEAFTADNAVYTEAELARRGSWFSAALPTGIVSFILMLLMVITALPLLRRTNYNTFYYVHLICSSAIFFAISIHASTNFYSLLPGLVLWMADWIWRFSGGYGGLAVTVSAHVSDAGGGWFRITLPAHPKSPAHNKAIPTFPRDPELQSQSQPLESYYLNIPEISKLQNHPFTAAVPATNPSGPVFLFQPVDAPNGHKRKHIDKEWTHKVGSLPDSSCDMSSAVEVQRHVEGPYQTEISSYLSADQVVCVVGGTGLTGAYSLALWWLASRRNEPEAHFTLLWTITDRKTAELEEWQQLIALTATVSNMSLHTHVSSEYGHIDVRRWFKDHLSQKTTGLEGITGRVWVYTSGPSGFLYATEAACISMQTELKSRAASWGSGVLVRHMDYYVAKWEV